MSIATGTKLGQYEVQDFLGQGAMGVVYRAYHAQLERIGAIKVMQAMTPDADTVLRFRHEAQAIAKLRHPNIVDVYDFGEFEGTPYMIVEYVPGGSLANRMAHRRLDQATALRYLRGIAAGLDYAHAHGVVHRDVKPANVLVSAEDTPVLADFGLAKLLQGSSLKSMTGVTTGTPAYMAPEQVAGRQVGPESDRYSLATIAYEMLTGVIPFDGEALMELLYAQVHRQPMPPSARYPDLGPAVDEVIMRGLAKDPAARWESCTAFVNALEAALASPAPARAVARTVAIAPTFASTVPIVKAAPAIRAPRAPRTEVMPLPPAVAPAAVAPTAPLPVATQKRARWPRRAAIAAAAVLLLVLIFGVCQALMVTTLALSPDIAARGQQVKVTAAHVPSNQAGTIELHSAVHTFAFRADSNGQVSTFIRVPADVPLGDHTVNICWNSACHASARLRVVEGTGIVLPGPGNLTPGTSPTPSPSPTPGATPHSTPTPGYTPRPTSPPTSRPTPPPTSLPNPSPTPTKPPPPPPSPTPTINPCPAESPVLTAPPSSMAASTTITVSGQGFTPNKSITVTLSGAVTGSKTSTVASNGTFSVQFSVPLLATGNATATATDSCGRQASKNFTILVGL
jgi:eukaryotic-like serine/threonine-protein kinase